MNSLVYSGYIINNIEGSLMSYISLSLLQTVNHSIELYFRSSRRNSHMIYLELHIKHDILILKCNSRELI